MTVKSDCFSIVIVKNDDIRNDDRVEDIMLDLKNNSSDNFVNNQLVDTKEKIKLNISQESPREDCFATVCFADSVEALAINGQTSQSKESIQNSKPVNLKKRKLMRKLNDSKMMKQVLRQLSQINQQVKEYCDKNKLSEEILPFRVKETSKTSISIPDSLRAICDKPKSDEIRSNVLPVVEEEDDILNQEKSQLKPDFENAINVALHAESSNRSLKDFHYKETCKVSSGSVHSQTIFVNESIHSQTIFINDINEPSTSKGIRHVHTDVQCGPDSVHDLTEINSEKSGADFGTSPNEINNCKNTVSWTKIHKIGIYIKESVSSMKTYCKEYKDSHDIVDKAASVSKSLRNEGVHSETHTNKPVKKYEFSGLTTANSRNVTCGKIPKLRPTKIKINDFDTVIQEQNLSTPMSNAMNLSVKHNIDSCAKPNVMRSDSNNKSRSCECKEVDHDSDGNKNNTIRSYGMSQQVNIALVSTKSDICPRLSFVGAQVHSYRNSLSEDIIYQGLWQNHNINLSAKKKTDYSSVAVNKTTLQRIMRSKMTPQTKAHILPKTLKNKEKLHLQVRDVSRARLPLSNNVESTQRNHDFICRPSNYNASTAPKQSILEKKSSLPVSIAYRVKTNKNKGGKKYDIEKSLNKKYNNETRINTNSQMKIETIFNMPFNILKPIEKQNLYQSSSTVKAKHQNNKKKVRLDSLKPKEIFEKTKEILVQKCHKKLDVEKKTATKPNNVTQVKSSKLQVKKSNTCLTNSFRPKLKDISNVPQGQQVNNDGFKVLKGSVSVVSKPEVVGLHEIEKKTSKRIKLPRLAARVEELTKEFYKIPESDSLPEVKYVLFCNEIKHKSSETNLPTPKSSNESNMIRNHSPRSEYASPTSSRDSVVTIKPMVPKVKSDNDKNITDLKTNEISTNNEDCEDIPKSKGNGNRALFTGRNKDIRLAQIPPQSTVLHPQTTRKSIHKIKSSVPNIKQIAAVKISRASQNIDLNNSAVSQDTTTKNASATGKRSPNGTLVSLNMSPECSTNSETKSKSKSCVSHKGMKKSPIVSPIPSLEKKKTAVEKDIVSDNSYLVKTTDFFDDKIKDQDQNICKHANEVLKEMKRLIEDRFQIIDFISKVHETVDIVSKQTIGSLLDVNKNTRNDMKTTDSTITESDGSSFKLSGGSEDLYFADNELSSDRVANTLNVGSVKEIFGRKTNQLTIQTPDGPLALLDFSGLSMNREPAVGDRPDFVNLVDSETGSIAGVPRRATSEECIVTMSVRSSESYATCELNDGGDDDVISVPGWLFQLLTQQHQNEVGPDLPAPLERPVRAPLPILDVNGNIVEAGAGDGRGIHSDRSWNSSGNGSSVGSSSGGSNETNSEEWLLVEPLNSAYETLQESNSPSVARSLRNLEDEDDSLRARAITPRIVQQFSDGDADISSDVDTDADVNSDVLNS